MTSFFSISFSRFTLGQIRKVVKSKETLKYIYKSSERVPKKNQQQQKITKVLPKFSYQKVLLLNLNPL